MARVSNLMVELIIKILLIIIGLWLFGNLLTGPLLSFFVFLPTPLRSDYKFKFDHPFEEIFLDTPNQGKINCLWFKNSEQSRKGVIVYHHGNAGSLAQWGFVAQDFVAMGYDFIIYDFRKYGKSKGEFNPQNFFSDGQAVYEFAAEHYPEDQIVLYGRSIGSGPACHIAAQKTPKMLILESPFYSLPDVFYSYFPFLPKIFYFKYVLPNYQYIKQANCPIYIFHGKKDSIVPYKSALKLKELLKKGDSLYTIEQGSHNDLSLHPDYWNNLKVLLAN